MKLSDVIDAIKSFFLDFLGYFLPGIYAILLLSYVIGSQWQFDLKAIPFIKGNEDLVVLLFAYIIGYLVYSIPVPWTDYLTKVFLAKKVKTADAIIDEIGKSAEYTFTLNVLKELWVNKHKHAVLDDASAAKFNVLSLRSIAMSYCPDSDTKIYTFMFRSELCRTIGTFSILCGAAGLLSLIFHCLYQEWTLFNAGLKSGITYFILILGGLRLLASRSRFLSIAYKIPFSIFLAKYYKID
jgi:hypothetical protein